MNHVYRLVHLRGHYINREIDADASVAAIIASSDVCYIRETTPYRQRKTRLREFPTYNFIRYVSLASHSLPSYLRLRGTMPSIVS